MCQLVITLKHLPNVFCIPNGLYASSLAKRDRIIQSLDRLLIKIFNGLPRFPEIIKTICRLLDPLRVLYFAFSSKVYEVRDLSLRVFRSSATTKEQTLKTKPEMKEDKGTS